ncbi:hypothetical protein FACS1894159_08380 [Bacteroidia bacterium]|nr:hypothetical protein FACS1894159_08380 [Bacteroidia bacterium]
MIELDDKLISEDVLTVRFRCDLARCKGMCCVEGDGGAPLEEDEIDILEEQYPAFKPFMTPEGIAAIEREGFFVVDGTGELLTPLVDGCECAYSRREGDVTLCAIEAAFNNGATSFRKPLSCHLYPVRLIRFGDGRTGLNYHRWEICHSALQCGGQEGVPLYRALREPLIRCFGEEFFEALGQAEKFLTGG